MAWKAMTLRCPLWLALSSSRPFLAVDSLHHVRTWEVVRKTEDFVGDIMSHNPYVGDGVEVDSTLQSKARF